MLEPLLEHKQELAARFRKGGLIFLDYDGTLTPIVDKPELAVLDPKTREFVRRLAMKFTVILVSGRSVSDLVEISGVEVTGFVGNHGLEIKIPGLTFIHPQARRTEPVIAHLCREIRSRCGHIEGVFVENKKLTASIHYRNVLKAELSKLRQIFRGIVKPYLENRKIRISQGKKVWELRPPVQWNKGNAVTWLVRLFNPRKELPVFYAGDDRTDEDAFAVLKGTGITVLVAERPRKSWAKFRARNSEEVIEFLRSL